VTLAPPSPPRFDQALARLRELHASPEYQARLAQTRAWEAEQRRLALLAACTARGVPGHPDVRAVVLDEAPRPTAALQALDAALAWRAANRRPGVGAPPVTLVLAGPPGNGKTTAGARLVARWPGTARRVLARAVGSLADNDWSENREAREVLARVGCLFVDEAGLEESARAGARVAVLLAERHDNAAVTVVATNLDAADFTARYLSEGAAASDRLISRLSREQNRDGAAGGLPWWWELPAADLRDPAVLAQFTGEDRP
jgi:hypothetical protein